MSLDPHSASAQYFTRPADEKFDSLEAIYANALADQKACARADVPLSSLEAIVNAGDVALRGKETGSVANLTAWSFGQLSRQVNAPAGYLRTLTPGTIATALNEGLGKVATADPAQLYLKRNGGLTLRAITTPTYERLHDATVIKRLMDLKADRPALDLPPVWAKGPDGNALHGGAYRGDRDSYVIMVDGGSIVTDPTLNFGGSNGTMYRGIIARNSEVGGAQVEILTFLFRGICGNHCIWGVENAVSSQSRHVGKVAERFESMITNALSFFGRPESEDVTRIKALDSIMLGKDKAEVITVGRSAGLSETAATESFTAAEQYESNPFGVWGYANGITRVSQQSGYQDQRFAMDMIAAKLMRQKVAA
jgi:hypothetical protein